ncbi:MAG: hypothetical protein KTR31_08470 [Myxococcales bacterium]|nr:hypothetical protein [Myxococcales bacterium]
MVASHPLQLTTVTHLRLARAVLDGFSSIPVPVREELAQEAAFRTWCRRGVAHERAYVRRTARNLAVDWLRHLDTVRAHQRCRPPLPPDWSLDDQLDVRRAIAMLEAEAPAEYRVVLRLYLEGAPTDELVEEVLGAPRRQVEPAAWSRARDLLYKRRARSLRWLRARLQPRDQ